MSATVTLVLENITKEIDITISNAKKQLDNLLNLTSTDSKLKDYLIKQKNGLDQYRKEVDKFISDNKELNNTRINKSKHLDMKKEIDSLSKRVSNLLSNYEMIKYFEEKQNEQSHLIMKIVKEYGIMAREALDSLVNDNIEISENNIINKINEIRNSQINEEKLKTHHNELEKYIDNQNFESSDLRYELKKLIRKYSSAQEITDCYAYISSKRNEISKIDDLANNLFHDLKQNEKFEVLPDIKTLLNDQGIVKKIYKLKNSLNNVIDITIDGYLNIHYKMGNYIGHACEKTSDKIFDIIRTNGYEIVTSKITRDISNASKVMYIKD